MQSGIVKSLPVTRITELMLTVTSEQLTISEQNMLSIVAQKHVTELELRRAGLSQSQIAKIRFARWMFSRSE